MTVGQRFYHPVIAVGPVFEVSCLGHPKECLEEVGVLFVFFVLGFCFFKINIQLVFYIVSHAIATYLQMRFVRMFVGGFSLVISTTRNVNDLSGDPSKDNFLCNKI